ncbi:MAG: DUF2975 domain-containing protein [Erysipelotrichaceae bacterium]|nr:DUF2975 domain-containing protein [Erysipelotrichaceae bacterium]
MEQKKMANWLKTIIAGLCFCGVYVYVLLIPGYGQSIVRSYPEFSSYYKPWLIFLSITAIPVYIALYFAWKVFDNIGKDHSFCIDNANYLKWISWLAAADSAYFFIGNVVLTFCNMNHIGVIWYSLIIIFIGVSVSAACAALSHLIVKAAELQDQSDLTV